MHMHGTCVAREGQAVLLEGPPGAGKSDLALRLIDRGFVLVADDQVVVDGLQASPPERLAGLLEIRGLGLVRLPYVRAATLRLAVTLAAMPRLPDPARHDRLDLPLVRIDPRAASAPLLVGLALDATLGNVSFEAGAFG
jgi:HPr kinase/phosphorylase